MTTIDSAFDVSPRSGYSVACPEADRALLTASGELDLAASCDLNRALAMLCAAGRCSVRIDLSGVTFMDCTCLGVLVAAHLRLLAAHGNLILTGVTEPIARLFSLTGLDRMLLQAPVSSD